MKKALILLFCSIAVFGRTQTSLRWEQVYGGDGIEYSYSTRSCLGQGYVVAGTSSTAGVTDGFVVRTDTLGLVLWTKYYVGNNVDVIRSIRQLPDSGFVLAGYSNSGGHGGYDGWLLRTDKNGDTLWTKYIGTPDWDFFYDVYPTPDSGFILAGGTYGAGAGDEDMYFVKTDENGDTLWTKTYGGLLMDEARSVIQTGDDSLIAACGFTHSLGDTLGDAWILLMDQDGDTAWTRTFGAPGTEDKAFGIAEYYPLSRLYVAGEITNSGNVDGIVSVFTFAGASLFNAQVNGAQADDLQAIVMRSGSYFAAIGTTFSYGGGMGDMIFYSDFAGSHTFGTIYADKGFGIDNTPEGGYIVCGFTEGYSSLLPNMYLVKIDSLGASTGVVSVREPLAPGVQASTSIFPNPATTEATITVDAAAPFTGELQIEIFDITGRKVMSVPAAQWNYVNNRSASCKLEIATLEAGVYTCFILDGQGGKCTGRFVKK